MSITFRCEHCHKNVNAPDSAAGKRGKCPHCGQTSYIPVPHDEEDVYDLAPLDDQEEQHRQQVERELLERQRELIAESGSGEPAEPLENRADLGPEDLYHVVVNYCLDMSHSNLERAQTHLKEMKKYRYTSRDAVDHFLKGTASEDALDDVPPKLLEGFLKDLRKQLS